MRSLTIAAALIVAMPASAQFGGLGALGSIGGIGKAGIGNVSGLLGYCVKNKLSTGGAAGMLGKLTGQPQVTQSPDYKQGLLGRLTGQNATGGPARPLSLDSLPAGIRTKACDLVLKRAGSFL